MITKSPSLTSRLRWVNFSLRRLLGKSPLSAVHSSSATFSPNATVLRLQSLAANVQIINMYGTTETQRAVSYFPIPPVSVDPTFLATQKDIMPAGESMVDVQLLVVNRSDKSVPCAVGEVGEIYVRSGGLAEGYLDPEASAENLVSNLVYLVIIALERHDPAPARGVSRT